MCFKISRKDIEASRLILDSSSYPWNHIGHGWRRIRHLELSSYQFPYRCHTFSVIVPVFSGRYGQEDSRAQVGNCSRMQELTQMGKGVAPNSGCLFLTSCDLIRYWFPNPHICIRDYICRVMARAPVVWRQHTSLPSLFFGIDFWLAHASWAFRYLRPQRCQTFRPSCCHQ